MDGIKCGERSCATAEYSIRASLLSYIYNNNVIQEQPLSASYLYSLRGTDALRCVSPRGNKRRNSDADAGGAEYIVERKEERREPRTTVYISSLSDADALARGARKRRDAKSPSIYQRKYVN